MKFAITSLLLQWEVRSCYSLLVCLQLPSALPSTNGCLSKNISLVIILKSQLKVDG